MKGAKTMAEVLAERFHQSYESLAPTFGYETRPETKVFDPQSTNGKLMVAVCWEMLRYPEFKAVQTCAHVNQEVKVDLTSRCLDCGAYLADAQ